MILINSSQSSALRINELESNPDGKDAGFEWVELYSEESVNLEGYILENGDEDRYNLSGIFTGYLVIIFPGLWLDNTNETVYLKQGESLIDETDLFNDATDDNRTWSFCDQWIFVFATQNYANNCGSTPPAVVQQNSEPEESQLTFLNNDILDEPEDAPIENNLEANSSVLSDSRPNKITLNKKDDSDKKVIVSKTYKLRTGVIYSFLIMCVFLIILLSMRRL